MFIIYEPFDELFANCTAILDEQVAAGFCCTSILFHLRLHAITKQLTRWTLWIINLHKHPALCGSI